MKSSRRATVSRWSAAGETKERCSGNLQHSVRKGYPLRCGIANHSVASVKTLGDPYFVFTDEAKHGSMLVGKPRETWLITLVNTVGNANLLRCMCAGLHIRHAGFFFFFFFFSNCRDKICAMPNPLSGKLLQGAVSFHVSLVILLFKRRAAHFSPVKGLAAISCRCLPSKSLKSEGKAAAFSHPRRTGCRHGRAFGKSAYAATAPPARR